MLKETFISVDGTTFLDAYNSYGASLEDGAISALMTPVPMKDFIESNSRLQHGKRVVYKTPRVEARELTLPFHITAKDSTTFFNRYNLLMTMLTQNGHFYLVTKYQKNVFYHLRYLSCNQFRQFMQNVAVFSLKVEEPNPNDRTITPTPSITW